MRTLQRYAQVRLIARKKEDEKFEKIVYVKKKLEEFVFLQDIMNSVYDKVFTDNPFAYPLENNCNYSVFITFPSKWNKMSWNIGDKRNVFLELKTKLGLYYVVPKIPKTSAGKITPRELKFNNYQTVKRLIPEKTFLAKKG